MRREQQTRLIARGALVKRRKSQLLRAIMALLLLLPFFSSLHAVAAQGSLAVTFGDATAKPAFPTSLGFTLQATAMSVELVRAEVAYSFTGQPLTLVEPVEFAPTRNVDVSASVDTQVNYIPPGVEVSYYWTVYDAAGNSASGPTSVVRYDDTRFVWQTLEQKERGLRLHWYTGSASFGKSMFDTANRALDRLSSNFGLTLTLPVEIWVYPDSDHLQAALPPGGAEWVGGTAFAQYGVILALINENEDGESEGKRLLPHELSHLMVYQATENPYNSPPAWLDEGLAVNNQETGVDSLQGDLATAALSNSLVPLRALGGSFPADPDAAYLSYAESASAVQFLLERYGTEKVGDTLAAFRDGVTYDEALEAGVGLNTEEVDQQWREWLPYKPVVSAATPATTALAEAQGNAQPATGSAVLIGIVIVALVALAGLAVLLLRRRKRSAR